MAESLTQVIDRIIKESEYDVDLIQAIMYHVNALKGKEIASCASKDEYWKRLISLMFINTMTDFKKVKYDTDLDENKDWPVPVLPIEHFYENKLPDAYRKKVFFECLEDYDILECKVASVTKFNYNLRVIHKYGFQRVLDGLNIIVNLPKNKRDKGYRVYDYVRVVVSKINREVDKGKDPDIQIDDNSSGLYSFLNPALGPMSKGELPFYVYNPPDREVVPTYADYLKLHPRFNGPCQMSDLLHTSFGVDPLKVYSFHDSLKDIKFSEESTGQALLKKSNSVKAVNFFLSASNNDHGNLDLALEDVTKGIDLYPKEHPLVIKLYILRSQIYEMKAKPKLSLLCLQDLVEAKRLHPNAGEINKLLGQYCLRAALIFYHRKDYERATKFVGYSLSVHKEGNSKFLNNALRLQKSIKRKVQQ